MSGYARFLLAPHFELHGVFKPRDEGVLSMVDVVDVRAALETECAALGPILPVLPADVPSFAKPAGAAS